MRRLSGIQKDVLSLFRRILRMAVQKDRLEISGSGNRSFLELLGKGNPSTSSGPKSTATSTYFASTEFRRQAASTKRSEFKKIEYMIRKGEKQMKLLQMPGVKLVSGTKYS